MSVLPECLAGRYGIPWQSNYIHTLVCLLTGGVPQRLERSAQTTQLNSSNEARGESSCLAYIQGPHGLPGRDGRDGLPGMRGEKGEPGVQGPLGLQGSTSFTLAI